MSPHSWVFFKASGLLSEVACYIRCFSTTQQIIVITCIYTYIYLYSWCRWITIMKCLPHQMNAIDTVSIWTFEVILYHISFIMSWNDPGYNRLLMGRSLTGGPFFSWPLGLHPNCRDFMGDFWIRFRLGQTGLRNASNIKRRLGQLLEQMWPPGEIAAAKCEASCADQLGRNGPKWLNFGFRGSEGF